MGGSACKLKVILDGNTTASELANLCYQLEELPDNELDYDTGIAMVKLVNAAENASFAAERLFLESQGFHGPWPGSMDNEAVNAMLADVRPVDNAEASG